MERLRFDVEEKFHEENFKIFGLLARCDFYFLTPKCQKSFQNVCFPTKFRQKKIVSGRATDANYNTQPENATWNMKGYLNNSIQVIKVKLD